jgi:hypothetical protein
MRRRREAEDLRKRINTEVTENAEFTEKKVRRRTKDNEKRAAVRPPLFVFG